MTTAHTRASGAALRVVQCQVASLSERAEREFTDMVTLGIERGEIDADTDAVGETPLHGTSHVL